MPKKYFDVTEEELAKITHEKLTGIQQAIDKCTVSEGVPIFRRPRYGGIMYPFTFAVLCGKREDDKMVIQKKPKYKVFKQVPEELIQEMMDLVKVEEAYEQDRISKEQYMNTVRTFFSKKRKTPVTLDGKE